jgi:hypothetical protein
VTDALADLLAKRGRREPTAREIELSRFSPEFADLIKSADGVIAEADRAIVVGAEAILRDTFPNPDAFQKLGGIYDAERAYRLLKAAAPYTAERRERRRLRDAARSHGQPYAH